MTDFQMAELDVLKEVLAVIERHNLNYFAIGGTCIGAIRHSGFIPWDDDIDIAMPREDYELFREKYYAELSPQIAKLDCDNSSHHDFIFFKVHNNQTTMVDRYAEYQPDRFTGAFVDIMPVDGLPEGDAKKRFLYKKTELLVKLNTWIRLHDVFPRRDMGVIQWAKDYVKKIIGCFFKNMNAPKKIKRMFSCFDFYNSKKISFTWRIGAVGRERIEYDSKWFKKTIVVPFEDIMIKVPEGYDDYLKQDFGDYMKLPPENERTSGHDAYIYDLSKPCSYYAEKERKRK